MSFENKEEFKEYAKGLFEKHCVDTEKPQFFPDFDEDSEVPPGVNSYELNEVDANWDVYRSLKTLSNPEIVLHRVTFNHNQFHIWDENYNPEVCASSENIPNCSIDHRFTKINRTDFVIFGSDYVVLINVCPWSFDEDENIEPDDIKNRISSLRKMQEMIVNVSRESSATTLFNIFKFIAFPKTDIGPQKLSQLHNSENISSITEDDLLDFELWLEVTIHDPEAYSAESFLGNINLIQETLFALWHNERFALSSQWNTMTLLADELASKEVYKLGYEIFKKEVFEKTLDFDSLINDFQKCYQPFLEKILRDGLMFDDLLVDFCLNIFDIYGYKFLENLILPIAASLSNINFFKSKKVLKSSKDYFELGSYLLSSFVSNDENFAQMFPACPNHVYIDIPKDTDQESPCKKAKGDLKKQQDYDAEVRVYRALELINSEKIVVLHGLRYSHHQYRMWMSDHNAKDCASCKSKKLLHSDEGENDFVVLGADYIIIIEVKNSETNASNSLSLAKEQLGKITKLIEGISKKSIQPHNANELLTNATATNFEQTVSSASIGIKSEIANKRQTVICAGSLDGPSDDNDLLDQAMELDNRIIQSSEETQENVLTENNEKTSTDLSEEINLSETETFKIVRCVAFLGIANHSTSDLTTIENEANIITGSDLNCFSGWLEENIAHLRTGTYVECQGNFELVKRALLALWASNDQVLDASKLGLAKTIVATDKKLRESDITFIRKKEYLNNPDIKPTTGIESAKLNDQNIFSDILKINFITEEQNEVFLKKSQKLIITGCIGSGKSLMLLARMLHEKLTKLELPMILLVFNEIKLFEYQNLFKKAGIDCTDVSEADFNQYLWRNTVGVIHCSTDPDDTKLQQLLQNLDKKVHLYVDDAHASYVDFLQFSHVCITLDFNQSLLSRDQHNSFGPLNNYDIISLTHNYRSTWNLVSNLARLSKAIEAKEKTQRHFLEFSPVISNLVLSHHPSHGHLIHGPQNVINVVHFDSFCFSESTFTRLLALYRQKVFQLFPLVDEKSFTGRLFLIDQSNTSERQTLFDFFSKSRFGQLYGVSSVKSSSHDIFSTEFTACFILLNGCSLDTCKLRLLFIAMSRARAYCEIFLLLDENDDKHELEEFLDIFKGMKIQHVYAPEEAEEEENAVLNFRKDF